MPEYNIAEVVGLVIGKITPIGESREDDERFENLKELESLVDSLIGRIYRTSSYKDDGRSSVSRSGRNAHNFLCELQRSLKINLEE